MPDEIGQGASAASTDVGTGSPSTVSTGNSVDWTQDPRFRAFQSDYDRTKAELEQERRQRILEQRGREAAVAQFNSVIEQVGQADPDTARYLAQEGELMRLRSLEQQMAAEQQQAQVWNQFRNYHTSLAREVGIDPFNSEFQQALNTGDHASVERVKAKLIREQVATSNPGKPLDPARQERADRIRQGEQNGTHVVLPTGGGAPSADDQLMSEYLEKRKAAQGNLPRLFELKMQYREKGLTID
jgi:hypothetical protein